MTGSLMSGMPYAPSETSSGKDADLPVRSDRPPPRTLISLLRRRVRLAPDDRAYVFLADGEDDEQPLTHRALDEQARRIAARLQDGGLKGERALLVFPPGLDYICAFFGCLYAGVIAVPAYPPSGQRDLPRISAIAADAAAAIALTTRDLVPVLAPLFDSSLTWLATDDLPAGSESSWHEPGEDPLDIAFLQYTSGSTRAPRGVMVTHANLLHNLSQMHEWLAGTTDNTSMSWLPPYHDMGLIGGILEPLYGGFTAVLMAPAHFIERPHRWLSAISRYRATVSAAPNFAYELCLRKVPVDHRPMLDLSTWRIAVNGAEPVRAETIDRFTEGFAVSGFRRETMRPCYGLAEATLLVTTDPAGTPPRSAAAGDLTRVACGTPRSGQELRIVDTVTRAPLPAGHEGEIWLSGPSVASGYWGRPAETAEIFQATLAGDPRTYLRTGDLGYLDESNRLIVTGRIKDLIIIRGRNLYPQDVELAAERGHMSLRPGCGAAFTVPVDGEERLVVVHEVTDGADTGAVALACRQALREICDADPYELVLIPPRRMPKTPSGKVQRHACRDAYLNGTLPVVGRWCAEDKPVPVPFQAPRDPLEKFLADIWADLLDIETVGVHDDFFLAGGDSLLIAQLVTRVNASLPVQLSVADVFEAPTIGRLADLLTKRPLTTDEARLNELLTELDGQDI